MDRIRIIAGLTLGCILLLSGCRRELMPYAGSDAIRFSMCAALTGQETPDTKFGVLMEGDGFETDDQVKVYGRRNTNDVVFGGESVTLMPTAGWSYDALRYWNWAANTDYYDFLAVYQAPGYSAPSCNFNSNPLTVTVPYTASAQYDLMLAGSHRAYSDDDATRFGIVSLVFNHMLCAVKVRVTNNSETKPFTFKGYHFEKLVVSGIASVTAPSGAQTVPTFGWDERSRLTTSIGGANVPNGGYMLNPESTHPYFEFDAFDLMIPQNHNEKIGSEFPVLVVDYNVDDSDCQARVLLKDVLTDTGAPAIPSWEMGKKYLYDISFNLDGGVQVRVTTTNWSAVAGDTPGILIPPLS